MFFFPKLPADCWGPQFEKHCFAGLYQNVEERFKRHQPLLKDFSKALYVSLVLWSLSLFHSLHRFRFALWIHSPVVQLTNTVAPEPEGSSPYSQEPATGPCPEPSGCTLHSPS
jgi:hypothetical protein